MPFRLLFATWVADGRGWSRMGSSAGAGEGVGGCEGTGYGLAERSRAAFTSGSPSTQPRESRFSGTPFRYDVRQRVERGEHG
jgi:hypothetical protein